MIQGFGCGIFGVMVYGLGVWVSGFQGFKVDDLGLRIQGSEFMV